MNVGDSGLPRAGHFLCRGLTKLSPDTEEEETTN